jgi:hypothetical protein
MRRRSSAEVEAEVLDQVRAGNVTWRWNGLRGTAIKIWASEHESRPATKTERAALTRLIASSKIRSFVGGGYKGGRGGYEPSR